MSESIANLRRENQELKAQLAKASDESRAAERREALVLQELAALRQRSDDHQKRFDEWDRRFWAVVLLLAGTIVSSAVALLRR
jgi:chromosome segregation ATPase